MRQPRIEQHFVKALKETRQHKAQISQKQLVDKLRELGSPLNQQAISYIETGARRVSLTDAYALSEALNTTPWGLVELGKTL